MFLRDHTLMSYPGLPSRPPVWTWIDGLKNNAHKERIGILLGVILSTVLPADSWRVL
jgi:hypothetical protein